jgi:uncharacterized protein YoxC
MSKVKETLDSVKDAGQRVQEAAQHTKTFENRNVEMNRHKLYGAAVVGGLASVALVLLIALEIQWLRYIGRKLKAGKWKIR